MLNDARLPRLHTRHHCEVRCENVYVRKVLHIYTGNADGPDASKSNWYFVEVWSMPMKRCKSSKNVWRSSSKLLKMPFCTDLHLWALSRWMSMRCGKRGAPPPSRAPGLDSNNARCSVGPPSATADLTEHRNLSKTSFVKARRQPSDHVLHCTHA